MRQSRERLVARLKAGGFHFREVECVVEGEWATTDVEWNYKDVLHVEHVHDRVRPVYSTVEDEFCGAINIQKVLGIRIPLSIAAVARDDHSMLYHSSFLAFVLVVETSYREVTPGRTRVVTVYSIGAPRGLRWCLPLIGRLLRRNYANLLTGDVSMRDRRSQLRRWGFAFKEAAGHSFRESLDNSRDNVVPPETPAAAPASEVRLSEHLAGDGEYRLGTDDHRGVLIIRRAEEIVVFPRLCTHEGASLDGQKCQGGELRCPWHGRRIAAIGSFDLKKTTRQEAVSRFHRVVLEKGIVRVEPR
jgi:Rieske 2Fe-2S protein